jgi:trigger factor
VDDIALTQAEGLRFKVVVDVPPDFKLPKYRKVSLNENPIEVKDGAADEAYKRLMDRFARFEEVAGRPAHDGDLVMVDYRGECEGKPLTEVATEAAGLGEGKDFWVMIGEPEFLPGFIKGLQGAAIGETRTIRAEFPAGFRVASVQGRTVDYTVQIKAIREKIPPVVDADFLKRFEVDSEAALKAKLRQQLVEAAEKAEKSRQKSEIVKFLLENTELDVPQSVVDEETDLAIRGTVRRIAMEGGTREQIREMRESIVSSAAQTATERVKVSYILSRIADEEKVEVADAEVDARIEAMAGDYGMPPEKMRAELEKRNGTEALKSDLRAEKTLDVILGSARVKKQGGA